MLDELFKVELGRARTSEEVRAALARVEPVAREYSQRHGAACDMPWTGDGDAESPEQMMGPERAAAFEAVDRDFPEGCALELAETALTEVLADLDEVDRVYFEELEKVGGPRNLDAECLVKADALRAQERERVVVGHLRNARYWAPVFGTDATVRIDAFSWILGVEPCYEPPDDLTDEENAEHERQVRTVGSIVGTAIAKVVKDAQ